MRKTNCTMRFILCVFWLAGCESGDSSDELSVVIQGESEGTPLVGAGTGNGLPVESPGEIIEEPAGNSSPEQTGEESGGGISEGENEGGDTGVGDTGGGGTEGGEEGTGSEELPPCLAHGVGFATLRDAYGAMTILEYNAAVNVVATHVEPGGCLSSLNFSWERPGGCGLTLGFSPSNAGIWSLTSATLQPGDGCGAGGTGSGIATLSEVPATTAVSPPPARCTVLWGPILAHGSATLDGGESGMLTLDLDGLGVDGMILSTAVDSGVCGTSYVPCEEMYCGVDALLGLECGGCEANAICEGGICKSVEPIVAVCKRVMDDRADLAEGTWTGSTATCEPGSMDLEWQEKALKLSNLYRWLAGQPPLSLNADANPGLQECAVMMHAGGGLTHHPSENWPCYTGSGSSGAGSSNLATLPAVNAVDLYMADPGNATTIGHRRWILSDWIDTTAFGSTSSYSCMQVVSGWGGSSKSWIAWPPPDYYPMEMHNIAYQTVDKTGWTIQTNGISLKDAVAQVKENGVEKPVEYMTLLGNYGSGGALKITPDGWKTQVNALYEVTVTGASEPISYSFQTVDCSDLLSQ